MSRFTLAALMAVSVLAVFPAAQAQDTPAPAAADFAAFNEACAGAEQFLLGEVPAGTDPTTILTPLCGCMATGFGDLPQADIDILATDLRGEGTDELHEAHGSYGTVEDKAREVLNACYASPEISALMAPPENEAPVEPEAAAEPETPAEAPAEPEAAAEPEVPAEAAPAN